MKSITIKSSMHVDIAKKTRPRMEERYTFNPLMIKS